MGYVLGVVFDEPGLLAFVLLAVLVVILAAVLIWAWVIKRRIGPSLQDRP